MRQSSLFINVYRYLWKHTVWLFKDQFFSSTLSPFLLPLFLPPLPLTFLSLLNSSVIHLLGGTGEGQHLYLQSGGPSPGRGGGPHVRAPLSRVTWAQPGEDGTHAKGQLSVKCQGLGHVGRLSTPGESHPKYGKAGIHKEEQPSEPERGERVSPIQVGRGRCPPCKVRTWAGWRAWPPGRAICQECHVGWGGGLAYSGESEREQSVAGVPVRGAKLQ